MTPTRGKRVGASGQLNNVVGCGHQDGVPQGTGAIVAAAVAAVAGGVYRPVGGKNGSRGLQQQNKQQRQKKKGSAFVEPERGVETIHGTVHSKF